MIVYLTSNFVYLCQWYKIGTQNIPDNLLYISKYGLIATKILAAPYKV
jgi:hypothetical protein